VPTPQSAEKTPGLDAFTFDYAVEWPLSLVLSKNAVIKCAGRQPSPAPPRLRLLLHRPLAVTPLNLRPPPTLPRLLPPLTRYQLIFRHLFHCKHVERQLSTSWLTQQAA
jgi:hypothetical protein